MFKRVLIVVAWSMLLAGFLMPGAATADRGGGSQARLGVAELRTEYARNPLGIDVARPRLSWKLESGRRGQAQTAYRVLVASRPDRLAEGRADVWDSGKVASRESVNVPYGGPALTSKTRYFWKVMVWDVDGSRSAWSKPAWWETALLDPAEWRASWIGGIVPEALTLEGSSWIWFPEEGDPLESAPAATRYFRRDITVPEGKTVVRARAALTADNQFEAYLNGAKVGESDGTVFAWQHAVLVDLTAGLRAGRNALAIAATNAETGAAGLVGVIEMSFSDGSSVTVHTDDRWKASDAEAAGWTDVDFDDSSWPAALPLAPYGEGPWTCCGGVQTPVSTGDPLLRKSFRVTKRVARARAYMAGLGYHELRLNGRKVGDSVLEGEVNDYRRRVGYYSYDVTRSLKTGENAIGVMLGRGLFNAGYDIWQHAPWRDEPKLIFQLEIRYTDGTTATIVSDGSWKTADGPITRDVFNGGEDYDARREVPGWDTGAFDDSQWRDVRMADPPGRLDATLNDPVEVTKTLRPVGMDEPKPGVYVLDMGHTITGWARLTLSARAGTTVTLRYGQKLLSDGTVDYAGWMGGAQTDRYTTGGRRTETWEPRFSFKSFRYVQVTGLPEPPGDETVVARSVHSAVESVGEFDSSSDLYDAFHDGMRRTILGNLVGYPAIDPLYEKAGWTEDVAVAAQSMIDNFDMARFLTEWLEDFRDSQLPSGQIPIIVPSPGWGYTGWGTPSPVWTAAYPIITWRMYENYGDRRLLEDHYPGIKRYLDREVSRLQDGIVSEEFLGDWVAPGYSIPPEDTRLAGTAYVYRQLKIVADMAEALGRHADAAGYRATAVHVRDRFNATFLNRETGRYETARDPEYRQTSNLLPLAFGMVPAEDKQRVLDGVVADIRARGDHLNTGTLGTEVILRVLTQNGYTDVAHAIASQRTYPSWGYWYANGADTMWESWDIGSRSRSHFFLGMTEEWFFADLAGITPAAPGYREITIRPYPGGGLGAARAEYDSVHGRIESAWRDRDGAFRLDVTIPPNTTATIHVPAESPSSVMEGGRPARHSPGLRLLRAEEGYAVFAARGGSYRFVSERE